MKSVLGHIELELDAFLCVPLSFASIKLNLYYESWPQGPSWRDNHWYVSCLGYILWISPLDVPLGCVLFLDLGFTDNKIKFK